MCHLFHLHWIRGFPRRLKSAGSLHCCECFWIPLDLCCFSEWSAFSVL
jgi:hypothetical protein